MSVMFGTEPIPPEEYIKPSKKNGWLVKNYATVKERQIVLAENPHKYRDWSPARSVRKSIVDPRFDVTLPLLKFLAKPPPSRQG